MSDARCDPHSTLPRSTATAFSISCFIRIVLKRGSSPAGAEHPHPYFNLFLRTVASLGNFVMQSPPFIFRERSSATLLYLSNGVVELTEVWLTCELNNLWSIL